MKSRPIPFSGPMAKAVVEGRKTQTRRVCKEMNRWVQQDCREVRTVNGKPWHALIGAERPMYEIARPYGSVGDQLWVREAWVAAASFDRDMPSKIPSSSPVFYLADGDAPASFNRGRYRFARFMPRWASRITLEVTGVRVERLQSISQEDARTEGIFKLWPGGSFGWQPSHVGCATPAEAFRELWDSINGEPIIPKPIDGIEQDPVFVDWDANPWVWVIDFKRLP